MVLQYLLGLTIRLVVGICFFVGSKCVLLVCVCQCLWRNRLWAHLWGLAGYVLWPFGKFVSLESDEIYVEEDEGYERSPRDYEQWQSGDLKHGKLFFGPESVGHRRTASANERDSLLGDPHDDTATRAKRRLFGRG